jgi:DTW domain
MSTGKKCQTESTDESMVTTMLPSNEAEDNLVRFLDECRKEVSNKRDKNGVDFGRIICETCNASRSLYCADCTRVLLPQEQWPKPLRDGSLYLPFDVDIILSDRRISATGVQLYTILTSMKRSSLRFPDDGSCVEESHSTNCRLFDLERHEEIPQYSDAQTDGTFLLFPGTASEPLSSMVDDNGISLVKRLVVLDCKWSCSSIRFHPSLVAMPHVHLDRIPKHSYFWRWHNAGDNMLSTIEAVYYSAWDVATTQPDVTDTDRERMVYILWLFGLIREIIQNRYSEGKVQSFIHPPAVPFLESSKEFYRLLRRQHRKSKQAK